MGGMVGVGFMAGGEVANLTSEAQAENGWYRCNVSLLSSTAELDCTDPAQQPMETITYYGDAAREGEAMCWGERTPTYTNLDCKATDGSRHSFIVDNANTTPRSEPPTETPSPTATPTTSPNISPVATVYPEATPNTTVVPTPEPSPTRPHIPDRKRDRKPHERLTARQKVAKEILALSRDGKIKFNAINNHGIDSSNRTTPRWNIKQTAQGEKALTNRDCGSRGGSTAPNKKTFLDIRLLRFMRDLGKSTSYKVNSVTGQCHSNGSRHYKGQAVDIGCHFSSNQVIKARRIGGKYNISDFKGENCTPAGKMHYHFSIGGH